MRAVKTATNVELHGEELSCSNHNTTAHNLDHDNCVNNNNNNNNHDLTDDNLSPNSRPQPHRRYSRIAHLDSSLRARNEFRSSIGFPNGRKMAHWRMDRGTYKYMYMYI